MIVPTPAPQRNLSAPARTLPPAWLLPDPDDPISGPQAVYEAACKYVAAGLSLLPISADGSKSPDPERLPRVFDEAEQRWKCSWKLFSMRPPLEDELRRWRDIGGYFGLAVVAGAVSGGAPGLGLEIIDCDHMAVAEPWMDVVEQRAPSLVDRLAQVQSPRPGLHLYYRCSVFSGNQKLACAPEVDEHGQPVVDDRGKPKKKTLIELKGEGGYCLVPPSPRHCHPRSKRYLFIDGKPDLLHIPVITPEERAILLGAARELNRWQGPTRQRRASAAPRATDSNRPGDDFNRRAKWADILVPHGWAYVNDSGGVELWRRPGKTSGHSATVNYIEDRLHVFSSNAAPFEDGGTYTKFSAHVLLNHDGDYSAAARALQRDGYGKAEGRSRVGLNDNDKGFTTRM